MSGEFEWEYTPRFPPKLVVLLPVMVDADAKIGLPGAPKLGVEPAGMLCRDRVLRLEAKEESAGLGFVTGVKRRELGAAPPG